MRPIMEEVDFTTAPEALVESLGSTPGIVLLRSGCFEAGMARYSFVVSAPFLVMKSFGSRCELASASGTTVQFGNPWRVLEALMSRYELLDELDLPFPTGGCFGYWGYDLKNFVEPKLQKQAINDLELPDCVVGFYGTVVVFDHLLQRIWIVATGLDLEGNRSMSRAREAVSSYRDALERCGDLASGANLAPLELTPFSSNMGEHEFIAKVRRAQEYIRQGDIYQVNLAQRLSAVRSGEGFEFFKRLFALSPAPFAAYLDCGDFQLASSSPESFMRMSGAHVVTRPIKGTRPRSSDPLRDAQLTYELQTSPKEMAELVMITDLLRNDLGRICQYGSVQVPDLVRLERYPHVQHLVSTVEGRLRQDQTHFSAFASCFPGGSVTGAPKIRAMDIIDELEPVTRGPYTGALGYLGFNRESQLSIVIRTCLLMQERAYFHVGAGIVADSSPEAEFAETMAKAAGFLQTIGSGSAGVPREK